MPSVAAMNHDEGAEHTYGADPLDPGHQGAGPHRAGGARHGNAGHIEPDEQVAAESGEAHTLGHGASGGDDYTAINPGGTSAEEPSSDCSRAER